MWHSFRFRIGLLSGVLSGILLTGLALYALSMISRVGQERVDGELRALADAQVRKKQPEGHWRRFDDSLHSFYGDDASRKFVIMANRPDGEVVYVSPDWPARVPRTSLPLPLPRIIASESPPPPEAGGAQPPENEETPTRPFGKPPPFRGPPKPLQVSGPVFATLAISGGDWRAMTLANEDVTLSMAMSLSGLESEMHRIRQALLVSVPLGLLLIVAGSWLIGNQALRPIRRLADTVETVTARRLDERIPSAGTDDEFKRLIVMFNAMLERLERSFLQATRFSADAAHELKTPLAILQAQLERTLQHAHDGSTEQQEAVAQLDEIQRLKGILHKLLLLSQADSGQLPLSPEPFDLAEMVKAAADDVALLAPDRTVALRIPASLIINGDRSLIKQVIDNIVSNAVKFGTRQGHVEFDLGPTPAGIILTLSNTGPVIPQDEHERIFERFYRADQSHGRDIEGTGLGLSLAREIARAHGGELKLKSSDLQRTTFSLTLPDTKS